jgi:hypothetical protein
VGDGVAVRELKDLVAVAVAVAACRAFAEEVLGIEGDDLAKLTEAGLAAAITKHQGEMWNAIEDAFAAAYAGEHIDKVPFAKGVVTHLAKAREPGGPADGVRDTAENFRALLTDLAATLRTASREEEDRRLNNRLKRVIDRFLGDHLVGATRDQGAIMLTEVGMALDDSLESEKVFLAIGALRRDFHLDEDLTSTIERFDEFRQRMSNLKYLGRFAHQDYDTPSPASDNAAPAAKEGDRPSPDAEANAPDSAAATAASAPPVEP